MIWTEEIEHLGELTFLAGMPVGAFIQTGERSALSSPMREE
jgi:hypothetical protein